MGAVQTCSICCLGKKELKMPIESDRPSEHTSLKLPAKDRPIEIAKPFADGKSHCIISTAEREACLAAVAVATDRFLKIVSQPIDASFELATEKDGCKVFTKDSLCGYIIRAEWKASFTPQVYLDFLCDTDKRKAWDPNIEEVRVIESLGDDICVFYQSYKKILMMSSRDLVLVCKKFECGNSLADVFCSVDLAACPPQSGIVRANITTGGYFLENLSQGAAVPLTRVISYSEGSCGGILPKSMVKGVSARNVPTYVKQLNDALKRNEETNSLS